MAPTEVLAHPPPHKHHPRPPPPAQHPDLENPVLPDAGEELAWGERQGLAEGGDEAGPSTPTRKISPFGAKAVAAMMGAVSTSLLMTPFDVLKTRLQTVQPTMRPEFRPPAECCQTVVVVPSRSAGGECATSTIPGARPGPAGATLLRSSGGEVLMAPAGCYHPSKWAGIWGEAEAVTFEQALGRGIPGGLPLEVHKEGGFWNEIAAVRRETGVRGLWKGVGTTLTMSVPSSAIYMLGYEYLLSVLAPMFANKGQNAILTPAPLVAGSLARTLSATIISPIEMFRTRLQALPPPGHAPPTYASTARDMAALVKADGFSILWRGLGPTLWRDVPFSGIYWAGFELLKSRLSSAHAPVSLSPIGISFTSGALSGIIAALLTQPFDVLKTRRQVFTPSPSCAPEALNHRASTIPLCLHIIKTEGAGALFAGVVPRCAKVAPACGLMIACYEGVGRWLGAHERLSVHTEEK